mmetsp:Transcript_15093/g.60633  ORF Transcript_15093/g.60633 Transcript_15093/m.60633 type:complete len:136 (+) Transcript_15093:250-657(+)
MGRRRPRRLYRRALKLTSSWAVDREIFCDEAEKLRAQFDANAALDPHSKKALVLVEKGEAMLAKNVHPDPYICPYMPGGTLYMRNPPLPKVVVKNWEGDDLEDEQLVNIDMTPSRPGVLGNAGPVFVNNATKSIL